MKKKSVTPRATAELHHTPRSLLRTALIVAVYLLAFVVLDIFTRQLEELPGVVAWYPPSGLTYTLLLVFGVGFTPAVTVALFISSLFVYRMPQPTYLLFLWAVVISLIYSAAAAFLRKRIHYDWHLRKLRDVIWFVLTAVLVSALLAILSVSSSALSSNMPRSEVLRAIFDWWIGETIGVLTITPFLLLFVIPALKRFMEGRPISLHIDWSFQRPSLTTIGQAFSIILALYLVFGVHLLDQYQPLYLISLPLIWVALSRGLKGISVAILALNTGVVLALWLFRFEPAELGELELLMIVNCMVGLLMGAVVNERKQAEDGLRESESTLSAWLNAVQESAFLMDLEGIVVAANATVAQRLHRSVEEMVGSCMYDFIPPENEQTRRLQINRVVESGQPVHFEDMRSGHIIDNLIYPVFDQNGQVKLLAALGTDITERKRTEAERQTLLEIMQGAAITESLPDLLGLIRKSLAKVIYAENFFVVFKNKSSGLFEEVFAVDKYDLPMSPSKLERSITSYVFRTGQPLLLTQTMFEEMVRRGEAELVGTNPAIWLGAPLKTASETIGVIVVQNYEDPNCYSERDKEFLASVGMQVSLAIVRKQAEETLRESERGLKEAQMLGRLGNWSFDLENQTITWSEQIYQLYERDPVLGPPSPEEEAAYYSPEQEQILHEYSQRAIEEGQSFDYDLEVNLPTGKHLYLSAKMQPIKDANGRVVRLFGTIQDITERKQAEQDIRESEAKYRTLVDEVNEGFYISDLQGIFTFANGALARILGFEDPKAIIGHRFQEFVPPEKVSELGEQYQAVLKAGIGSGLISTEVICQDGSKAFIEIRPQVIIEGGQVVGNRGTCIDITERKQREEEIRSRTDELKSLYQLSRSLADANELESVIGLVNRHAVESVQTTFACIALIEDGNLVPRAVYPVRNMEHNFIISERQPISALPFCQSVLDKNEPVVLQTSNPEVSSLEHTTLMFDFAKVVCLVPLWAGDDTQRITQALGLLILGEAREEKREPFTPEKIRLARSIGDQAAAAIRRLLLHEHAGRRLQHLASLSEIDRSIASSFDLRLILQMVLKHVIEQLEVDAADVLVFNTHIQALEFAAGRGFRSPLMEGIRVRLGEGQAGQAMLKRKIIQITDVATSGAAFAYPELLKAENVVAYFAVPLITKGKVKGVLEICNRTPLDPSEEWLEFLNTLAGQAAIAIDNVQMFDNLQRSTDELELAYDATIEGWSRAMDLRDKETEGHTLRVTDLTIKLARTFGLSEAELVQVRWGALLHDIGNMGVPDGILLKPGPLTDEEWVAMKKHTTFAYEMLSPIRYLHAALDIPYCHHEKWDGTGYPRGLKGEQIPLVARIFAVVDVWDALTSDRPYRQAWPEDKVRQHIQAESGTHFDPQVVKTFFLEEK